MKIMHNITSLNALNKLKDKNNKTAASMEKLSSGLRINSAKDDAAGLAISEKMRGQIRGLEQAQDNIQDGISLTQTAEGGLQEVTSILQRARELSVQSANDTFTKEDREEIQKEIDQLVKENDKIATGTEFNTTGVLGPKKADLDVVFFIDDSSTMQEEIDLVANGISSFVDSLGGSSETKVGVMSVVHSTRPILNLTKDINEVKNQLTTVHTALGGSTSPYEYMRDSMPDGTIGSTLGYREDSQKIFVLLTDTRDEASSGITETDVADLLKGDAATTSDDIKTFVLGLNFATNSSPNSFSQDSAYDDITTATGGSIYKPVDANDIKRILEEDLAGAILRDKQTKTLNLQIGANAGDSFTFETSDMRSFILGIDNLKVDSYENAQESIKMIDKALATVTSERSRYGALQNRLEHVYNNSMNYSLNITESESRIRDVDMAKEMMSQTKNSILSQAAQAMLAQANQQPQGVLQLLR
jgi:flagellin